MYVVFADKGQQQVAMGVATKIFRSHSRQHKQKQQQHQEAQQEAKE